MNGTPGSKSRPLPKKSGTRVLPPAQSQMSCQTCGYTATFDSDWQPGHGLNPDLYQFTCKLGHHSYRAIIRRFTR